MSRRPLGANVTEATDSLRQPQNSQHCFIQQRLFYFACTDSFCEAIAVMNRRPWHLNVKARADTGHSAMGAMVVGHDEAVEAPLFLHHPADIMRMLSAVDAIDSVVRRHYSPSASSHRHLERQGINLPHDLFGDYGVHCLTLCLRIVAQEVLHRASDMTALNTQHPL